MNNSLIENIKQIDQDFEKFSDISRNNFLALMVKIRLEDQTEKYDKEFDKIISWMESSTLNISLTELSKTLKDLKLYSETIQFLYSCLINRVALFNNVLLE